MTDLADTLAAVASNPFLDAYVNAASASMSFDYLRVQKVAAQRQIYFQKTIAEVGGQATAADTANIAFSVTKRTGTFGRTGVGRMQFGGMPGNVVVQGKIATGFVSFVDAIAATLSGPATPGATYLGSYENCLPGAILLPGTTYDVIATTVNLTARTMHRRTVGLGI